jgi:4-hydroxy-tetrahydrodipicolinate synthase
MNTDFIRGVVPPLVTPVDGEDRVQEPAFRRILKHVLDGGVHGVFALGSTGEFFGLDDDQQKRAIEIAVDEVAGRVPVFAGVGAVTTRECVRAARRAEAAGAQAITVLPPPLLTPTEDELFGHFQAIADATPLPLLIYNNPDRIRINVSANLVERLAQLPTIVGAKDSSGDMSQTGEYIRRTQGTGFKVMAGRDTLILATLVYGGVGCVATTANVAPALVVKIYDRFQAGDLQGALQAQYQLAPLRIAFNLGSWPVVTKDALNLLGLAVGAPILPNTACSGPNLETLGRTLRDMGLLRQQK